jgi:hypothetical protein
MRVIIRMSIVGVMLMFVQSAWTIEFSIFDIQYTTDPNSDSQHNGSIIDCVGGIVTHKPPTGRPRLIIQDPAYPEGWSSIQVKDLLGTGIFSDVNVGDWISLTNVLVEENKGTTFLQYIEDNNAGFEILSSDSLLPKPLIIGVDTIAAPVENPDAWYVSNHNAEKYESMLIQIIDVTVMDAGYGKAYDNYILQSNIDPNLICWASDYMNADKEKGLIYHPEVVIGSNFCSVIGILEQYTAESDGVYYDYYQLLTTDTDDFKGDQIADFDGDCDVDFFDFRILADHWLGEDCGEPNWCDGADMTGHSPDGVVDIYDLIEFAKHWLEGKQ